MVDADINEKLKAPFSRDEVIAALSHMHPLKAPGPNATQGFNPSYIWRSILYGKEILERGISWAVGNGHLINLSKDAWIPGHHFFRPDPIILDAYNINKVRDLLEDSGNNWNQELVRSVYPNEVSNVILSIPLSLTERADLIAWNHTKNDNYSVRSGYWVAMKIKDALLSIASSSSNNIETWQWFWKLPIPPRIKIFLWRCMKGTIPTKTNLVRKYVEIDQSCPRCDLGTETPEHAFRDCPWVSFFWEACVLRLSRAPTNQILQDWIFNSVRCMNIETDSTFAIHLWSIWRSRNLLVFQQSHLDHVSCFSFAMSTLHDFKHYQLIHDVKTKAKNFDGKWKPPPAGVFKLNTDASITGIGGLIRNHMGNVLEAFALKSHKCTDVITTEALACLRGIQMAKDLGVQNLIVEVDNLELANALINRLVPRSCVGNIIHDIFAFTSSFSTITFCWTKRDHNKPAHELARLACSDDPFNFPLISLPFPIYAFVIADATF
ncbi:hypothetical protein C2S52_007566 [Perilla frutescens var. hirtella]|nr:hypothetical protein C2S52_007566 [Perilla frutescens var. hirtella]